LIRNDALTLGVGHHSFSQRPELPKEQVLFDGPSHYFIGGQSLVERNPVQSLLYV
jgi:hypothetical protein